MSRDKRSLRGRVSLLRSGNNEVKMSESMVFDFADDTAICGTAANFGEPRQGMRARRSVDSGASKGHGLSDGFGIAGKAGAEERTQRDFGCKLHHSSAMCRVSHERQNSGVCSSAHSTITGRIIRWCESGDVKAGVGRGGAGAGQNHLR